MFDTEVHRRRSVSLTPLIDVVFLLLIFFMLASSFLQTQALTMITPSSEAMEAPEDPNVVELWLMNDGSLRLDGEPVTRDAVTERLRRTVSGDPDKIVSILSEPAVTTQALIEAIEAARLSGAETVATGRAERLE